MDFTKSLRGLGPYLRPYRATLALGVACAIVADLLSVIPPRLIGTAMDTLQTGDAAGGIARTLAILAVWLVALEALEGLFGYAMRRLMIGTSRHVEYAVSRDVFAHLMTVPPSTHDRLRAGDLMSRLTNDLAAVREVLGPGIMWAVQTGTLTVLVTSLMVATNPRLAGYALLPLPVLFGLTVLASRAFHRLATASQEALAALSSRSSTVIGGIRVVQAFRREAAERDAFDTLDARYRDVNLESARVRAVFMPGLVALPGLSAALVLWAGGHAIAAGEITLGTLATFLIYIGMLVWPMLSLGWVVTIHQRGAAALERLQALRAEPAEDAGGPGPAPDPVLGALAWQGCTVAYGAGPPVLRDLTLAIAPGRFVALVGPIGAGKSSLLATVPRLLDPPRGTVTVDGRDVRDWPLDPLRASVAIVPQLPFLFSDTVHANIAMARPDAPPEAVAAAAAAAGLTPDLAQWPDGLQTVVGERGVTVSGGQRQRIAIARALLADPPVLLLDDCLSSLDAETAEGILARLRAARQGGRRTTLLATHRIAEAARCDEVVVLERGRVLERGPHATLVAAGGLYTRLVERQRLATELGEPA